MAEPFQQHSEPGDNSPAAEPPAGGRQDHDAMRAASTHRIAGPAGSHTLAASGGLDVPGREPHEADIPAAPGRPEPIPGERDPSNLTHRQPAAMGGRSDGSDTPPAHPHAWMDEKTAREHAREGGDTKP